MSKAIKSARKHPPVVIGNEFETSYCGKCIVTAISGNGTSRDRATVNFPLTGTTKDVSVTNLRKGQVRDPKAPNGHPSRRKHNPVSVGDSFESNSHGSCTIVEVLGNGTAMEQVTVKFTKTGFVTTVKVHNLKLGQVRDLLYPVHGGVGFIGEGSYDSTHPAFAIWRGILDRCYNEQHSSYNHYKDTIVDTSWFNYQNFAEWYVNNYVDGYHLDKDVMNSSTYGPDSCMFLPPSVNVAEAHLRATAKQQPSFKPAYAMFIQECIRLYKT